MKGRLLNQLTADRGTADCVKILVCVPPKLKTIIVILSVIIQTLILGLVVAYAGASLLTISSTPRIFIALRRL